MLKINMEDLKKIKINDGLTYRNKVDGSMCIISAVATVLGFSNWKEDHPKQFLEKELPKDDFTYLQSLSNRLYESNMKGSKIRWERCIELMYEWAKQYAT